MHHRAALRWLLVLVLLRRCCQLLLWLRRWRWCVGGFWRPAGSFFLVCFRRLLHGPPGFGLGGGARSCLPLLLFMRRATCKSKARLFLLILITPSFFFSPVSSTRSPSFPAARMYLAGSPSISLTTTTTTTRPRSRRR